MCPHGGQVTFVPTQGHLLADSSPAILTADTALVVGCPFNISGAPSPCLTIQWLLPATRPSVNGTPVLLNTSIGVGMSPAAADRAVALAVRQLATAR